NITVAPDWGNFNASYEAYLLDPTDPLFFTIGKKFIEEITSEFGTDHMCAVCSYFCFSFRFASYNCDTFNEMDPPTNASSYLAAASKAVVDPIRAADPQGIWLMQVRISLCEVFHWSNVTLASAP